MLEQFYFKGFSMRKLGLSVVALSLVANCAFAQGAFVGAKIGPVHDFNEIFGNTHAAIGINAGYDFDKFRVYGEINHNFDTDIEKRDYDVDGMNVGKIERTMSSTEYILGADYYLSKIDNIKLFAGGFVGSESRTVEEKYTLEKAYGVSEEIRSDTISAFMLGARFGGIYPLSKSGDLEFSASLSKPFHEGVEFTKLGAFVGYTYKF